MENNLPTITVADLQQTIFQYILMFQPYKDQLMLLESQADPEHLEALASRENSLVNRAAVAFVSQKHLPQEMDIEIRLGLFVRLLHNYNRLDEMPPDKLLYLAYLDQKKTLQPCNDPLEFVLLHARTESSFPFLSPSK